ncbi:hypothetical protein [Rhodococcus jostii]|uniref:hypothetical protein n=1 Tax=Rhodococcus jostii TaxID=132919 RepID=UPI003638DA82
MIDSGRLFAVLPQTGYRLGAPQPPGLGPSPHAGGRSARLDLWRTVDQRGELLGIMIQVPVYGRGQRDLAEV